jgi:hypothetical protein
MQIGALTFVSHRPILLDTSLVDVPSALVRK